MKKSVIPAGILFLLASLTAPLPAFTVMVMDGETNEPIESAWVNLSIPHRGHQRDLFRNERLPDPLTDANGRYSISLARSPLFDPSRDRISHVEVRIETNPGWSSHYWYLENPDLPPGNLTIPVNLRNPERNATSYTRGPQRHGGYLDSDTLYITTYPLGSGKFPHAGLNDNNYDGDTIWINGREIPNYDRIDPDSDGDGVPDWADREQFSGIEERRPPEYGYPPRLSPGEATSFLQTDLVFRAFIRDQADTPLGRSHRTSFHYFPDTAPGLAPKVHAPELSSEPAPFGFGAELVFGLPPGTPLPGDLYILTEDQRRSRGGVVAGLFGKVRLVKPGPLDVTVRRDAWDVQAEYRHRRDSPFEPPAVTPTSSPPSESESETPRYPGPTERLVVTYENDEYEISDPGGRRFATGSVNRTASPYSPDNNYRVVGHVLGDFTGSGEQEVALIARHVTHYPSQVLVLRDDGAIIAQYWNPGHVYTILASDITGDGVDEIIVGATNYDAGRSRTHVPAVFALDARTMAGEAPPRHGRLRAGQEVWYTIVDRNAERQGVRHLEVRGDRIIASLSRGGGSAEYELDIKTGRILE